MASEQIQRQIDQLLDEAEAAIRDGAWDIVRLRTGAVLRLDPANEDAEAYLKAASEESLATVDTAPATSNTTTPPSQPPLPASFAGGRYAVRRFLGEGGRKRVSLAHDSCLDRKVAFCSIRTDGLDLIGHECHRDLLRSSALTARQSARCGYRGGTGIGPPGADIAMDC